MAWIKIKGLEGLVYEPPPSDLKKHNCKDCFSCQMCSNDRCAVCRGKTPCRACPEKKDPCE
ncbi:hypothetical protein ACFLZM_03000 [Thermodesulfobacteriota bacterium]